MLAQDRIALRLLDHVLDLRQLVSRDDHEMGRIGAHPLVGARIELDLLGAAHLAALADDRHRLRERPETLVQGLDLLVDRAVDRLVVADPARTFVHDGHSIAG
jgi:hypothetical protein